MIITFDLTSTKRDVEWIIRQVDENLSLSLANKFKISPFIVSSLIARGISTEEKIQKYLNPSFSTLSHPFELPGIEEASKMILKELLEQKRVTIYSDFDADGLTAATILSRFLREIGFKNVSVFIPERFKDGYGLNIEPLKRCLEQYQPQLLITVDTGTSAVECVKFLKKHNINVIITDHHQPVTDTIPGSIIINPHLSSTDPSQTYLCGAGIAFKLCHGILSLLTKTRGKHLPDLRRFVDLAAIGTVADVVPLLYENRIFVSNAIRMFNKSPDSTIIGNHLIALLKSANISSPLDTWILSYIISPRLNAPGRIGKAEIALNFLTTDEKDTACSIATELNRLNEKRQSIEQDVYFKAVSQVEKLLKPEIPPAIILYGNQWHEGVIGIVASRIVELTGLPVAIITQHNEELCRGSVRGNDMINVCEVLSKCASILEGFGGHKKAGGFTIHKKNINTFYELFLKNCSEVSNKPSPCKLFIDAVIELKDITDHLVNQIYLLQPFGESNPEPLWMTKNVKLSAPPRIVGSARKHLQFTFTKNNVTLESVGFNMADRINEIQNLNQSLDICYAIRYEEYGNIKKKKLFLKDFRTNS